MARCRRGRERLKGSLDGPDLRLAGQKASQRSCEAMSVFLFLRKAATLSALAAFLLPACTGGTGQTGKTPAELRELGCGRAVPEYDRIISESTSASQLAQAYYYRGECRAEEGAYLMAYKDYYAARIMGCEADQEIRGTRNRIPVLFMLCSEAGPRKLAEMARHLTREQEAEARREVEASLPPEAVRRVKESGALDSSR